MKIILAGFNLDTDTIRELREGSCDPARITPETLSAAYARISRDPRPVDELRAEARAQIERCRKSNETIIFEMGHHSVAEHAVFNFDLLGISRLAVEEVEKFRLCSYTEKSQRYVTLKDDHVTADEIVEAGLAERFEELVAAQNEFYGSAFEKLRGLLQKKLAAEKLPQRQIENLAKEDARYAVSLSTQTQLGMTVNARNLELMLRRFSSSGLHEARRIGGSLLELARAIAPSILLFPNADRFNKLTYPLIRRTVDRAIAGEQPIYTRRPPAARLVRHTKDADDMLAAALMHSSSRMPYDQCVKKVQALSVEQKAGIIKTSLQHAEFYDAPVREFEHVGLTFELTVSASCFAQLKRHRMSTQTMQPYDPALGCTIPASFREAGLERAFARIIEMSEDLHDALRKAAPAAAAYPLTNAHRRRVLLYLNARELYHLSRLREDRHAQWDIRNAAAEMSRLAAGVMPLSCMLLCGKDKFPEAYRKLFGTFTGQTPPDV